MQVGMWIYDFDIWESRLLQKNVKTDSSGFFEIYFEKGEAFDLLVSKDGKILFESSETLTNRKVNLVLVL